jgi:ATP phosphoribosyltransferase
VGATYPFPELSESITIMSSRKLTLGLPKGSLQQATLDLFEKAGWNIYVSSRSYRPTSDDCELELRLIRAQEIGRYVDHGFLDCGITGKDWIAENRADVNVVCDLAYSRASTNPTRWVLVVPEDSPVQRVEDLEGKRIATESVGITTDFLKSKGVNAEVEFSWGATEVKVPELVDAIVDVTETGSSLRANKLRIVDTLMESFPQFIANKSASEDEWKRSKIDNMALLLGAAQAARDVVGLKMNIPADQLDVFLEKLPALRNPTVSRLADENWMAIETVLNEAVVRELIPKLKGLGAEGIIEYPLNKLVL